MKKSNFDIKSDEIMNEEANLNFNVIENDKIILSTSIEIDKNELNDLLLEALVLDLSKKNKKEEPNKIENPFPTMRQINIFSNQIIQLCDNIPEEKFLAYCKESINDIKNWSNYAKIYLKKIFSKINTQNIFYYRTKLKEPYKSIFTDFILTVLSKEYKLKDDKEDEIPYNLNLCPEEQFKKTTITEIEFLNKKKKREKEEEYDKKVKEKRKEKKRLDKEYNNQISILNKNNDELELDRDDILYIELIIIIMKIILY